MKCELAQEKIALAVYGELPDDETHQLDQHLAGCAACRAEMEQVAALERAMALYPVEEPAANLLARSRMRLEEALDALPPRGMFSRMWQALGNGGAQLKAAPVAACALLMVGVGGGTLGGYKLAQRHAAANPALNAGLVSGKPAGEQPMQIAGVSSIVREPQTGLVQVRYNQVVPQTMQGTLDDPAIRQMLMLASRNAQNPDIRDNSIGLLAAGCSAGQACAGDGDGVRDALMVALRYDRNAGVRLKALKGLEPYVADDTRVRDAVLESMMGDTDPQVRAQAIGVIAPVQTDSSVRQVLSTVAAQDQNPHIRTVSQQVLSQMPEFQ